MTTKYTPVKVNNVHNGIQKIYKFGNNYGASVIQNRMSYGNEENLWELAVIKFFPDKDNLPITDDSWLHSSSDLCYDTPITDDVIGWLTEDEVEEYLSKIEKL